MWNFVVRIFEMAEFLADTDPICGSQDSVEVEIVSDDEFKMLDEAIQNAMMEEGRQICQVCIKALIHSRSSLQF